MKKSVLFLFVLLITNVNSYAQDSFFNDLLRRQLLQILVSKNISHTPAQYGLFVYRNLGDVEDDGKYGIFDFHDKTQMFIFSLILLRNGDEYEVLDIIDKDRSEIKSEIKAYFERNPDVPDELFPTYIEALYRVKKEHAQLEKAFDIKLVKDDPNDSVYRYVQRSTGDPVEYEVIID